MALREILQKQNNLVMGISITAIIVSIGFIAHHMLRGGHPPVPYFPDKAFYTTDDGATLFADGLNRVPPFDHAGTPAVRAYVFTCDGGTHQWVQYLEKYSDKSISEWHAPVAPGAPPHGSAPSNSGLLAKRPGARSWIEETNPQANDVMAPTPPQNMGGGLPVAVNP